MGSKANAHKLVDAYILILAEASMITFGVCSGSQCNLVRESKAAGNAGTKGEQQKTAASALLECTDDPRSSIALLELQHLFHKVREGDLMGLV